MRSKMYKLLTNNILLLTIIFQINLKKRVKITIISKFLFTLRKMVGEGCVPFPHTPQHNDLTPSVGYWVLIFLVKLY
jgi:hypothetical protein